LFFFVYKEKKNKRIRDIFNVFRKNQVLELDWK
jgi:hypothetical protein